jgi:hypothetical protein
VMPTLCIRKITIEEVKPWVCITLPIREKF